MAAPPSAPNLLRDLPLLARRVGRLTSDLRTLQKRVQQLEARIADLENTTTPTG